MVTPARNETKVDGRRRVVMPSASNDTTSARHSDEANRELPINTIDHIDCRYTMASFTLLIVGLSYLAEGFVIDNTCRSSQIIRRRHGMTLEHVTAPLHPPPPVSSFPSSTLLQVSRYPQDEDDEDEDEQDKDNYVKVPKGGRRKPAYYDDEGMDDYESDFASDRKSSYFDREDVYDDDEDEDEVDDDDWDDDDEQLDKKLSDLFENVVIPNPLLDSIDPDGAADRFLPELARDPRFWLDFALFIAFLNLLSFLGPRDVLPDLPWF
jgi:hypothetical protein